MKTKLLCHGRIKKKIVLEVSDFKEFNTISVKVNPNTDVKIWDTDIKDTVYVECARVSFTIHKDDLNKYVESYWY